MSIQAVRYALSAGAVASLLSGCAESQVPALAPDSGVTAPFAKSLLPDASVNSLYSFEGGADGAYPDATPIYVKRQLFGTTTLGGNGGCRELHGCGTVYKLSSSGQEHVLHAFTSGNDGAAPSASMIDVRGSLLGTTVYGGGSGCKSGRASGCGTVFELTSAGDERVLYRFTGAVEGAHPDSSLVPFKRALYGEAAAGGSGKCNTYDYRGCGLVYEMSRSGRVKVVYRFKGDKDGGTPQGGLVLLDGNFYGTTTGGGSDACYVSNGCGTVFKLTPSGSESILHAFTGGPNDGAIPVGGLVVLNGALYGATSTGGAYNCGLTYYLPCGAVFKLTPSGQEQIIYNFKGGMDGASPNGLIAAGGTLYGTTESGGQGCNLGCGTIFELSPSGNEAILYRFKGGVDPAAPTSGPIEVRGTLYGTTEVGGRYGDGTVYAFAP
jgi:uncharacterized repeat protein (TIGR03803 family)